MATKSTALISADPGAAGAQLWPPGALRRPAAARRSALETGAEWRCARRSATGERRAARRQVKIHENHGRFDVRDLNVSGYVWIYVW